MFIVNVKMRFCVVWIKMNTWYRLSKLKVVTFLRPLRNSYKCGRSIGIRKYWLNEMCRQTEMYARASQLSSKILGNITSEMNFITIHWFVAELTSSKSCWTWGTFCCDFLLLMDVKEWMSYECSEKATYSYFN